MSQRFLLLWLSLLVLLENERHLGILISQLGSVPAAAFIFSII